MVTPEIGESARQSDNRVSSTPGGVTERMEALIAMLFEAAGVSRRWGENLAGSAGQTQARWPTMWTTSSGSFTVPQIARRLGVSRQNVQRLVNELVAEGFAGYADNPDHKASPLIELTPIGQDVLATINAAAASGNQRVLDRLSERTVAQLHDLLTQLITAINDVHASGPESTPEQKPTKRSAPQGRKTRRRSSAAAARDHSTGRASVLE